MSPVKNEIPFLAALVLVGTSLSARVAAQGAEQALFSTVIEYCLNERMRKVISALVGRWCLALATKGGPFGVRKLDMFYPVVVPDLNT